MRIACVYLPALPLQAHVRQAPHVAGMALAAAESSPLGSTVTTCSRAAWAEGVRPGMSVSTARAICPELRVIPVDRAVYRRTIEAVVESLMVHCEVIDAGGDFDLIAPRRAIYVDVPARTRGASFGQKLLTQLSRQGLRGRVGIADDRFTAYVAALRTEHRGQPDGEPPLFHQSCTVVARGGAAAFLAPLSLGHLPIDPDIKQLLETCGVKTMGDFAALPPPSVARDRVEPGTDYQALARGQGPATLNGLRYGDVAARPIVERIDLEYELHDYQPLSFILRTVCDRVSDRLQGRNRAANALELSLADSSDDLHWPGATTDRKGRDGAPASTSIAIPLDRPARSGRNLLDAIRSQLDRSQISHPIATVWLRIAAEVEAAEAELDLFAQGNSQRDLDRVCDAPQSGAVGAAGSNPNVAYRSKTTPAPRHSRRGIRQHNRARQQVLRLFD
ncbi:MAG: hypothetical protein MJE77_44980 [Proteobacteria bacterium]|nr:hypothetical protein [Pseudomonadota bacterium]